MALVTRPRGRLARSDSIEMDTDAKELEITKLQRQIRIMEGDRHAYNLQAREQIRKQKQEKAKLLKEQEELHLNIAKCENISHMQQYSEDGKNVCELLEQGDVLKVALRKEKVCQNEIEKQVANMELKLADLRKGEVRTSATQGQQERQTQKAKRTLEHKVERALTHISEQLNKNCQLRKELETLRFERARFQQLQNRLNKELHDVRKNIGGIASLSIAAYDARVEVQSTIAKKRERAVMVLEEDDAKMRDLERLFTHDCRFEEFMTTKCKERSWYDDSYEMEPGQGPELKERRTVDPGKECPHAIEEVLKEIQTVTGEDNMDLLVTRFIRAEAQNFALFNFVNEQNSEAEAFRDKISKMQAETEKFRVAGLRREEDHHLNLRHTDKRLKEIESQAEDYKSQASIINKLLDKTKTGVSSIFSRMERDFSLAVDTLGCAAGINEHNIMTYLGLVEQKTHELLTMQPFLESAATALSDLEKDYNPEDLGESPLGQNPELLQQATSILPAVNIIDYDAEESPDTEEEEWPLSQEELHRRIKKKIRQRVLSGWQHQSLKDQSARRQMAHSVKDTLNRDIDE